MNIVVVINARKVLVGRVKPTPIAEVQVNVVAMENATTKTTMNALIQPLFYLARSALLSSFALLASALTAFSVISCGLVTITIPFPTLVTHQRQTHRPTRERIHLPTNNLTQSILHLSMNSRRQSLPHHTSLKQQEQMKLPPLTMQHQREHHKVYVLTTLPMVPWSFHQRNC